jgi:1,4-alpha-glucan branching enzyme
MADPFTAPTSFMGMGAMLQPGGVSYRVWAPNATAVTLGGDFFHPGLFTPATWQEFPMARDAATGEGAAYWSIFVAGAVADTLYKFKITNPNVDPTTASGAYWPYRHDPYAKDATAVDWYAPGVPANSVVVDQNFDWSGDNFQMPNWNELLIYELHIGTFNRDQSGVQSTFDEAKARLNYIADLGFNAIEIMPAFDFATTTSMGYNPALPFAMANAYGTLAAMKSFIKAAHIARLAVILDVVYNHLGPGLESCLQTFDGTTNPGWQGFYFYQDNRMYSPFGSRPDFGRGEVRQYIRDNAIAFCLQELHADGLRLDSTIGIRHNVEGYGDTGPNEDGRTLLRWLGEDKRSSQAWKILIAEDLQNDTSVTEDALFAGVGLDAQWDNWFLGRLRQMMFASDDADRGIADVAAAIAESYNNAGSFQRIIYLESHDEAHGQHRIPDQIAWGNANGYFARKRSTLGAALLMAAPGIPMIFMGQEFLEYAPWTDSLGYSLTWSRVDQFSGIVSLYRRLAQLRRNFDNNTRGLQGANTEIIWADPASGIIVFRRFAQGGPGDDVVVVANLTNNVYSSYNIGFPDAGTWYLRFNSAWQEYSADFGNIGYDTTAESVPNMQQPCRGNVGLDAYAVVFYSQ